MSRGNSGVLSPDNFPFPGVIIGPEYVEGNAGSAPGPLRDSLIAFASQAASGMSSLTAEVRGQVERIRAAVFVEP